MFPSDRDFLAMALGLGRRHAGTTWPNPSVGCLIVSDGRVLGRGVTARGGAPHAEILALNEAGGDVLGACVYVSLEPCAHQGKTPPCANALADAGVARVVYPFDDPDPRVGGKGRTLLEDRGIEVVSGVMTREAARDLSGFLARNLHKRPHVTLKLAISSDGKIAATPGKPTAITGALAVARGHLMRAHVDAVMVGIGTILADDPQLTCRLDGLEDLSPVRVVADTAARLPLDSGLARTARDVPVWLLAGEDAPERRLSGLAECGVEIMAMPVRRGHIVLPAAFAALAERGINNVMVEGGAEIAQNVIKQGLIDEVALFRAPAVLGPDGLDALAETPLSAITENREFTVMDEMMLDDDRLTHYMARARC